MTEKKSFITKVLDKLDKDLGDKSKCGCCSCCSDTKKEDLKEE